MITESELKRLADKRGWNEARITRILEQAKNLKPNKQQIMNMGLKEQVSVEPSYDINGIGDVMALSTGTFEYRGKTLSIDLALLQELADIIKQKPLDVYVGHQMVHHGRIGLAVDPRVSIREDDTDKYALYLSVNFPDTIGEMRIDKELQARTIDGIKNGKIKNLSPKFRFITDILSDGNEYITDVKAMELSFIPDIGYELIDALGNKSISDMEPVTDAKIVEFVFADNKMEIFISENNDLIVNVAGKGYTANTDDLKAIAENKMVGALDGIALDDKEIKNYNKLRSYNIEHLRDNEFMWKYGNDVRFVNREDGNINFSEIPNKVKDIKEQMKNLSEIEKKYI